MNWADWGIVAVLAISSLISLRRGFVKEALSLLIWLAAVVVATSFRSQASTLLVEHVETPSLREMLAFALLFIATLIVGACVNFIISQLVKVTGLSGTDRLLGMLFGLARGLVVVMTILILLPGFVPVDQDPWWQTSQLIPRFLEFEDWSRERSSQILEFVSSFFA